MHLGRCEKKGEPELGVSNRKRREEAASQLLVDGVCVRAGVGAVQHVRMPLRLHCPAVVRDLSILGAASPLGLLFHGLPLLRVRSYYDDAQDEAEHGDDGQAADQGDRVARQLVHWLLLLLLGLHDVPSLQPEVQSMGHWR